jgi:hypothetical protein
MSAVIWAVHQQRADERRRLRARARAVIVEWRYVPREDVGLLEVENGTDGPIRTIRGAARLTGGWHSASHNPIRQGAPRANLTFRDPSCSPQEPTWRVRFRDDLDHRWLLNSSGHLWHLNWWEWRLFGFLQWLLRAR